MKIMRMTKIEKIWSELENQFVSHSDFLYKRYSADIIPNVFIALKSPENIRCLAIRIDEKLILKEPDWNKFREVKIETLVDQTDTSKKFLLILLLNRQHKDIFSTLCEDLIFSVSDVSNEEILVAKLLERLAKWQSLFEKVGTEGLSDEAQRGLFGEVFFLRKFLINSTDKITCLKSWLGSEKSIQDFQDSNWALEVKTTHGNNHQKIQISSERQLDDSLIGKVFLYHLSLDIRKGNGESLNSLIDEVSEILLENIIGSNLFKLKLLQSGYYPSNRPLYEEKGYSIRQENIYWVKGNFPRLIENQIPIGVGDVKYSIVLSETEEWRINQNELFKELDL
jgi:hypothetical protein